MITDADILEAPFPHEWHEWGDRWQWWLDRHPEIERTQRPEGFPTQPNLMTDEVLGFFRLSDGRVVELAEVYIPAPLGPNRLIGYTFAPWSPGGDTGLVDSLCELEEVLGL